MAAPTRRGRSTPIYRGGDARYARNAAIVSRQLPSFPGAAAILTARSVAGTYRPPRTGRAPLHGAGSWSGGRRRRARSPDGGWQMSGLSTPLRPRRMPTPVGTATACRPPRTRSGTRDRAGRGASPRGPRQCRRRAPGSSGPRAGARRRPPPWRIGRSGGGAGRCSPAAAGPTAQPGTTACAAVGERAKSAPAYGSGISGLSSSRARSNAGRGVSDRTCSSQNTPS